MELTKVIETNNGTILIDKFPTMEELEINNFYEGKKIVVKINSSGQEPDFGYSLKKVHGNNNNR